jgi:hypothetical protein
MNSMMSFVFSKYREMFMTEICDWKLMRIICDVQSVKALIRLRQLGGGGGMHFERFRQKKKPAGLITAFLVPT